MSSRTPEARRAARAATQPQPTPAERARAQLAAGLPGARPEDLDAVADVVAERAAAEGFDLAAAVADLVAIWQGEAPEARADRHAASDRGRADLWWRSRLAADGIAVRSGAPRAEVDRPVFAARRWASANASALAPRIEEADRATG